MDVIAWVSMGALVGWLASVLMGPHQGQSVLSTMLVGIAGAILGGWLLDPLFGAVPVGELTVSTLAMPFVGGVVLVAAVWFYRRNFS